MIAVYLWVTFTVLMVVWLIYDSLKTPTLEKQINVLYVYYRPYANKLYVSNKHPDTILIDSLVYIGEL